jgi:hypothetical protein
MMTRARWLLIILLWIVAFSRFGDCFSPFFFLRMQTSIEDGAESLSVLIVFYFLL